MGLTFEWDEEKSKNNFKKHTVTFEEAKTVLMIHLQSLLMIRIIQIKRRDILILDFPRWVSY
jgi:uncharacterized DUF497 family protein